MSAALRAANVLALLRLAAYAELLDAGCPDRCIDFRTVSGGVSCGLWVCGVLAWKVCATWDSTTSTLDVADYGWCGAWACLSTCQNLA